PLLAITDGTSNTLLFGETYNNDPNWNSWATAFGSNPIPMYAAFSCWSTVQVGLSSLWGDATSPLNYLLLPFPGDGTPLYVRVYAYGSGHTQGANFAFCDGSVRFISNAINNAAVVNGETFLQALSTRAGGEVVDASQY